MHTFLHNYLPGPIAFSFGSVAVHWYGLLIVLGGLIGFSVFWLLGRRYEIKSSDLFDLAFYWVIFGVIGARLYYVIYAWELYSGHLLDVFKLWQGGLSIHGAVIGGFVAVLVFVRQRRLDFWLVSDLAVVGIVLAQAIGRWGNYFNQEIFGRPTDLPWGIPISVVNRPPQFINDLYFHPTFLYESLGNLIIFGFLVSLHWLRGQKGASAVPPGLVFFSYIVLYSILRFMMEFLRVDFAPLILDIRYDQIFSLILIVVAVVFAVAAYKSNPRPRKS